MLRWGEFKAASCGRGRGPTAGGCAYVRVLTPSKCHPTLLQIVPIRRCNLACTYCNVFDAVSALVSLAEMLRRVDQLGRLGTTIITISGGEPLLPRVR